MKQRQLGAGGPMVGAIGFGCMSFAGFFGETDEETSLECLDAVIAAGINFWDTANVYGMGRSENVIGKYLAQTGAEVVLATKATIVPGPPRRFDNSADHLRSELERSLERLGRDKVELFYIHRREAERPVEEVAETLAGFIEEGLIDGYGMSEVAPDTIRRAHRVHPCRAVQNEYSLWTRLPELGVIQTCAELGIAFVPFSPVARGFLTNSPITRADMVESDFRYKMPRWQEPNQSRNLARLEGFAAFCERRGWCVSAVALAWVLARGDHLLPIPATRTAAHLAEWSDADQIALSAEDMAEIERLLPAGWAAGDRYDPAQYGAVERYC